MARHDPMMNQSRTSRVLPGGRLALVGLCLVALPIDCSSKESGGPPTPQITAITGSVTDTSAAALAGVAVSGGGTTATTDATGKFQLNAPSTAGTLVTFTKAGFVSTLKRVDVLNQMATGLAVVMMPEAAPVTLDLSAGGTASGARGATLTTTAGAFVDRSGSSVSGSASVYLTPFDPSDASQVRALPNLSANTQDGKAVELESFGVLDVTVRMNGEPLNIGPGKTVTVRIPAPAGGGTPPATIPLWSFDPSTGRWKQEGTATFLAAEKVYEAQIGHLSMWNADQPLSATCIKGLVKTDTGAVLPGAYMTADGIDYSGTSSATAGTDGRFCMVVRKSSKVRVWAIHPSGGGTAREVQSGSADTTVPPDCSSPACLDVGEWAVKAGTITGTSGTTKDCKDVQNPFAGTCADNMWGFAACFAAAGACTVDISTGEMSWANGARIVQQGMGSTGGKMTYYGPGGQTCGSATFVTMDQSGAEILFTDATSNSSFTMKTDTQGTTTIVCPDGRQFTLTSEASKAFEICAGTNQQAQQQCTVKGLPNQCDPSNASACPSGQKCCNLGSGIFMCLPGTSCP